MEELIEILTKDFKDSVSESDEELIQAFKNMLLQSLEYIRKHPSENVKEKDKFERIYITSSARRILELPLDGIKRELIKDENLESIRRISIGMIFKAACEKIHGETRKIDIDFDKEIKKMKGLLGQVKPYNQGEARILLSEAVLDANFIENPDTEIYSRRLYGEKQNLERQRLNKKAEKNGVEIE